MLACSFRKFEPLEIEEKTMAKKKNEWWRKYLVKLPAQRIGDHEIQHFTVSESAAYRSKIEAEYDSVSQALGLGNRSVEAGKYTRLMRDGDTMVMSDTPAEIRDHRKFIDKAKGRVLIHGLGIGMCARAILLNPKVEHVLVVEKSEDVLELVAPTLREQFGDRIEFKRGDAFRWRPKPDMKWDMAWHDIWDQISDENVPEMDRLVKRFEDRVAGWQGCWLYDQCVRFGELYNEAKAAGY